MPICKNCNKEFPKKININGDVYFLSGRKFCTDCSPIGSRNTRSYIINLQENEAYCARCNEVKGKENFYIRNNGKPFSYCISCQDKVKQLKLEEKIERIIQDRGGACQDCETVFPSPVYDFYSEDKVFHISKAKNMSIERLMEELSDYIMICKNCCAIRKWEKN
jgi:hypothetical protein